MLLNKNFFSNNTFNFFKNNYLGFIDYQISALKFMPIIVI